MDLSAVAPLHPTFDPERKLVTLMLDHGKANEMGIRELDALDALCDLVESDASVMCLCTTSRRRSGRGKPLFIAGANVTERVDWSQDRVFAHVIRQRSLMRRIRQLPVFHVVLTHGVTLGWGAEFLLTADYVLATSEASFALPETGLGIIPGAGGSADLADLIGPAQALRLGCTGETIGAAEALRIGLIQELIDDVDKGLGRVDMLARNLLRRSPTAVAAFKRAVVASRGVPERQRLELERRAYEHTVTSGDAAIGRENFASIVAGDTPPWSPRNVWQPEMT